MMDTYDGIINYLHTPEKLVYTVEEITADGQTYKHTITFKEDGSCLIRHGRDTERRKADPQEVLAMFRETERILREADDQLFTAEVASNAVLQLFYPHCTVKADASLARQGVPLSEPVLRMTADLFPGNE